MMKRPTLSLIFLGLTMTLMITWGQGRAWGYLLSPSYVLKRMVQGYRSLRSITAIQRVEAYGEDTTFPFASVDEKVFMEPIVPVKIWIDGKLAPPEGELPPDMDVNPFLLEAQRQYGFYKDVFFNHQLSLVTSFLEKLEIAPVEDRLRLVYPDIAYQIGNGLSEENRKGLWIDKDRFVPLWLIGILKGQKGGEPGSKTVEIHYGDYRLLSNRIWIPFDIKFFVDGKLSLRIRATSVTLTTY